MTRTTILPLTGLALALSTVSVTAMEGADHGEAQIASADVIVEADAMTSYAPDHAQTTDPAAPRSEADAMAPVEPDPDTAQTAGEIDPAAPRTEAEAMRHDGTTQGEGSAAADPAAPRSEAAAMSGAGPTHDVVGASIAAGNLPMAVSMEGEALGQISAVRLNEAGVPEYALQLDPGLQLELGSVTFRGDASVEDGGHVMLQISRTDFVEAVSAHTQTN